MIECEEVNRELLEAGVISEVEYLRRENMRLRLALDASAWCLPKPDQK